MMAWYSQLGLLWDDALLQIGMSVSTSGIHVSQRITKANNTVNHIRPSSLYTPYLDLEG